MYFLEILFYQNSNCYLTQIPRTKTNLISVKTGIDKFCRSREAMPEVLDFDIKFFEGQPPIFSSTFWTVSVSLGPFLGSSFP